MAGQAHAVLRELVQFPELGRYACSLDRFCSVRDRNELVANVRIFIVVITYLYQASSVEPGARTRAQGNSNK